MKNNLLSEKLVYNGNSLTPTHLHLCMYNAASMTETSGDTFDQVEASLDATAINWLQVHGLEDTETIGAICAHFDIDFLVVQDILNVNHPTKIEEREGYIVFILKLFCPAPIVEEKDDDDDDDDLRIGEVELLRQQVCVILGSNYVLTFVENETDFFDDVSVALRNDVLKMRSRPSDYLMSVLLNSIMANYRTSISNISDALEDLEEQLLNIRGGREIGAEIQ
ncbi:MAG: magnesium and cobalt transport protein CorA, partial [Mediterranea sp.]|nr:magnesium and cobalt transport protein CorA [Mediterranea sp.]